MKKILAVLLMTFGMAALMPVQAADDDRSTSPGDVRSTNRGSGNGECKPPRHHEGENDQAGDQDHKHSPRKEKGDKGDKHDNARTHGQSGCHGDDDSNRRPPDHDNKDD